MIACSMSERMTVASRGGRELEVELDGPADGRVLIFHNGTPTAGRLFATHVEAGAERGLRHVTYSRPGYAESERDAGRSIADCAQDVRAITDALGAERVLVLGVSGGGPHALACAGLLGERVAAAATLASVAPWDAEGLDWLAGMGKENQEEFAAALAGDTELRAYLEREGAELARASGPELYAVLGDLVSEPDRAALTGDYADYLAGCVKAALASGVWGWFDDDIAFLRPWGFDLETITTPVTIWQGEQDRFVPSAHGAWLGQHVGSAHLELRPEHGHLSLQLDAYADVLEDLLARA
jgi:pimeloyl-ACP methyl ester carboxylesterase